MPGVATMRSGSRPATSSTWTWPFGETTWAAAPGACRGPLPLRIPSGMPTSLSRAPSAITSSAAPGSSATIRSGRAGAIAGRSPAPCTVTG